MAAATGYSLISPGGLGHVGTASQPFVVTLSPNGGTARATVVTPASTVAGTFTPTTVALGVGVQQAIFVFTPSAVGTASISTTSNNSALTNPASVGYPVAAALTPQTGGGGPGSDTTAVHVGETTTGNATLTGDVASATSHVGTVSPAIERVVDPSLIGGPLAGLVGNSTFGSGLLDSTHLWWLDANGFLRIFNVSDPTNPTQIGSLAWNNASGALLNGRYVYGQDYDNGGRTRIVDLIDPTNPTDVGHISLPVGITDQNDFAALSIRYLLVQQMGSGIARVACYDCLVPTAPVLVSTVAVTVFKSNMVVLSHRYAILSATGNTPDVSVIDYATPASPTGLVTVTFSGFSGNAFHGFSVLTSSLLACVANNESVCVLVDMTTPAAPTFPGSVSIVASPDTVVALDAQTAAVLCTDDVLRIIDCSTPAAPSVRRSGLIAGDFSSISPDMVTLNAQTVALDGPSGLLMIDVGSTTPYVTQSQGIGAIEGKVSGEWQVGSLAVAGNSVPGPGVDTSAVHLAADTSSPETGSAAITGDFAAGGGSFANGNPLAQVVDPNTFVGPTQRGGLVIDGPSYLAGFNSYGGFFAAPPDPTGVAAVIQGSGAIGSELPDGVHGYQVTALDFNYFEALPSGSAVNITIDASHRHPVVVNWDALNSAVNHPAAYNIYRDGLRIGQTGDGFMTTFTDDGSVAGGSALPTVSHAGDVVVYPAGAQLHSDVTARSFLSNLTGGGRISSGSGVPTVPGGVNPTAGDIYFRTDTPGTPTQRIYVCTVGGGTPTWVGIL